MEINVETVVTNPLKVNVNYTQTITDYFPFEREMKISPKSCMTINAPGYKQEFFVESVSILIDIGKNHSADLIMSKEAWEEFRNGAKLEITTTKQFRDKIIKRKTKKQ